jgi:N-acetylglucosaminyl-diphospho-decaprenol L-rhamnosyltransferase
LTIHNSQFTIHLSIIIVSWNVRDLLRACLRSIDADRADLDLEVIVVDAASHDGSPAMIQVEFPWVKLIACSDNVGFPRGNNLGIGAANGRYLLLLNPDTELHDGALATLLAFLDAQPDVGVVGPQLLNSDGTVQSSRRRFPTLATALFESTWLEPLAPKRLLDRYYMRDLPDDQAADVDWLTGACLLVRRQVVDQVGLLDEDYFMYSEELDWCRRIKAAGWRLVYLPAAQIVHHLGKSSEQAVTARHVTFQRAKLRYWRKYHGRAAATFLRIFLLATYAWQMAVEVAKAAVGHKRTMRWQRIQVYWKVLRSGLRPAGY